MSAADLTAHLAACLSPDNAARNAATAVLDQVRTTAPGTYADALTTCMLTSPQAELRALSAVLLRRCLGNPDTWIWEHLQPQEQAAVKQRLVQSLSSEKLPEVIRKVSDTAASLAGAMVQLMENPSQAPNLWPELFAFELHAASDPSQAVLCECALVFFRQLANVLLDEGLSPFLGQLHAMLLAHLQHPVSPAMGAAAVDTTLAIVKSLDDESLRQPFVPMVLNVLGILQQTLSASDEESSTKILQSLLDVLEHAPEFYAPHVPILCNASLQLACNGSMPRAIRHLAIEFMCDLSDEFSSEVRAMQDVVAQLMQCLIVMVCRVPERSIAEWSASTMADGTTEQDATEDSDENSDFQFACEILDGVAVNIGGRQMSDIVLAFVQASRSSADWRARHAWPIVITQVFEGLVKHLAGHLKTIVPFLRDGLSDPHDRVRWSAVHCLAQLSTDFAPKFQKDHHKTVLPALIAALHDANPRVQGHAATAVIAFAQQCTPKVIGPHMDTILSRLFQMLHTPNRYVQEEALSAIAAVADSASEHFIKYYDTFIPIVKKIITDAKELKEYRELRGKAIEAASLIGLSVGKAKFGPDAREIMEMMYATQSTSRLDADDPQIAYLQTAWVRICTCLGEEFAPYLPFVIPPLIEAAGKQADTVLSEIDEPSGLKNKNSETVVLNIKGMGDKRVCVSTSMLQEKSSALSSLVCYASQLPVAFGPYVQQCAQIVLAHFMFPYLEDVREKAWALAPLVIYSAVGCGDLAMGEKLLHDFFPLLLKAMEVEPSAATASHCMVAMCEMIENAPDNVLSATEVNLLIPSIASLLKDAIEKKAELLARAPSRRRDEEDELRLNEDKEGLEDVAGALEDLAAVLVKKAPVSAGQSVMTVLAPMFLSMLERADTTDRRIGVCFVDDMIEKGGLASNLEQFQPYFNYLTRYASSPAADLAQACVYGLGSSAMLADHTTFASSGMLDSAMMALSGYLQSAKAREDDFAAVTTNAISSMYKIMDTYRSARPDLARPEVWLFWISFMPCGVDEAEAAIVHQRLMEEVMVKGNTTLASQTGQIIRIAGEILGTECVNATTEKYLLQYLQQPAVQAEMAKIWAELDEDSQECIQELLTKGAHA